MSDPAGRADWPHATISAVFMLPRPIKVASEVLRDTAWEPFGRGASVKLRLPVQTEDGNYFTKPRLPDVEDDDEVLTSRWVATAAADDARELCGLGMLIRLEDELLLRPREGSGPTQADALVDHAFQLVDRWADLLRTWIEVCTAQDLDADHPLPEAELEGAGLTTWARRQPGEKADRRDRSRTRVHMRFPSPAGIAEWTVAVRMAGLLAAPPLEHVLMRDARAAYMRHQGRRMVIEAATAAELALNQLLARNEVRRANGKTFMLNDAITQCTRHHLDAGTDRARLDSLREARNGAAHEGGHPDYRHLFEHLETAQHVVDTCVPLSTFVKKTLAEPLSS